MRLFPTRFTSSSIQKLLDYYSMYNPTPMSIKQFIDFGKLFKRNILLKLKKNKNIGNMRCYPVIGNIVPWNNTKVNEVQTIVYE